jgi:hypothetical protein
VNGVGHLSAAELALLHRVRKARDVWQGIEQLAPQLDDEAFAEAVQVGSFVIAAVVDRLTTVLASRPRGDE